MAYKYRNAHLSNIIIDGEDCTKYFTFPFTVQETLDESLDSAMIVLSGMKRKEPFRPFSDAELGTDKDGRIDMLVANDEVKEIFGRGLYNHEITLIEPTKLLERYIMGAKAFTNHQIINYTSGAMKATLQITQQIYYDTDPPKTETKTVFTEVTDIYLTKFLESSVFLIHPIKSVWYNVDQITAHTYHYVKSVKLYFSKEKPQDEYDTESMTKIYGWDYEDIEKDLSQKTLSVDLNTLNSSVVGPIPEVGVGYYVVEYITGHSMYLPSDKNVADGIQHIIKVGTEMKDSSSLYAKSKEYYTIKDVLSTLNRQIEPLIKGENPRFSFSWSDEKGQTARVNNTRAPEFKFPTGRSYWENLREVFKFMHWMPRLKRDRTGASRTKYAICVDELGGNEYADLLKGERFSGSGGISAADYADALEANVSNLINADDELEGSIITPCAGETMGITIRSDNARIKQEDSYIPTPYPIEKLLKLEAYVTIDGTNTTLDLTPYVFEKTEYDTLSSFSGVFPHSKTYALYYMQGQRNIEGLWYRVEDATTDWQNVCKRYTITNIYNAITGKNDSSLGYFSFIFRVTYIPSVTARVRQFKSYKADGDENGVLVLPYNQSANKPAARAFGENMRGQIAMLGNKTKKAMYLFGSYNDIPKPGLLFDDENYISTVTTRVHPDFCISEISLSEGYNELGGYLELNNAYRQFEIPAESERHYHIDELCMISTKAPSSKYGFCANSNTMEMILRTIGGGASGKTDVTLAEVNDFDDDGNQMHRYFLPIISTSIGNSLYFGFRYEDNFKAGCSSVSGDSDGYRYTRYDAVGNVLARIKYLQFNLWNGEPYAGDWLAQAHDLPCTNASTSFANAKAVVKTPQMIYDKDAADGGDVSYQLHFVTDSGFIIGDALARQCPLVRSGPNPIPAKIFFFGHRINELTGDSGDIGDAGSLGDSTLTVDYENGTVTVDNIPSYPFKAWKIAKPANDCLIGCNSETVPKTIYFGFKRH